MRGIMIFMSEATDTEIVEKESRRSDMNDCKKLSRASGVAEKRDIFAAQWWKGGGFKKLSPLPPDANVVCQHIAHVLQGLWLFYAIVRTN